MKKNLAVVLMLLATACGTLADNADKVVEAEMGKHPIPGVALEVIQNGQCIKRAAYGKANLEWEIDTTPETVFEIGSMTKQFTATAIMLLVQEGKLSVDDKISQHLKDTPDSWRDITVRNLLTHTSGIQNYTVIDGFEYSRHMTQAEFIKKIGSYPLNFQPGEKWSYCNTAFNLLAYIVENVSGKHYWDFMSQRIFLPLGMTHTTNRNPATVVRYRASGYEMNRHGHYFNRDYDITDLFGAGAIISTVDDLAKWNASLDSHQLLTAETEKEMWTPVTLKNGKTHGYGFGFFLDTVKGHKNVGHGGSTSGFSSTIQRFPDDGLAVIVLTNANEDGTATRIGREVAATYLKGKN